LGLPHAHEFVFCTAMRAGEGVEAGVRHGPRLCENALGCGDP
jgi:hypothetical protein